MQLTEEKERFQITKSKKYQMKILKEITENGHFPGIYFARPYFPMYFS